MGCAGGYYGQAGCYCWACREGLSVSFLPLWSSYLFLNPLPQVEQDPTALLSSYLHQLVLPWSSIKYYSFAHRYEAKQERDYLEREGGAFDDASLDERVPALPA